jgi:beta-lactamase class A
MILTLALAALAAVCSPADLRHRMETLAAPARGHVGSAVMLVETGEMVSWQGSDRFPMQSVYKFPIAMAVLRRVDDHQLDLKRVVNIRRGDLAPGHSPSAKTSSTAARISPSKSFCD